LSELELLRRELAGVSRVSPGQRELILDAFERSGLSERAFAEGLGVRDGTFRRWVRARHRVLSGEAGLTGTTGPIALVEAVLDGGAGTGGSVEVETPGGLKVHIARREDIALAVALLRALREESC
jgi:hypothetical protein